MEKREASYIVSGDINWKTMEKIWKTMAIMENYQESEKILSSRICKEHLQLNNKRTNNFSKDV